MNRLLSLKIRNQSTIDGSTAYFQLPENPYESVNILQPKDCLIRALRLDKAHVTGRSPAHPVTSPPHGFVTRGDPRSWEMAA